MVNLYNGRVHSLSDEHSRCRLGEMRNAYRVYLTPPVPKTTQKLLYQIGLQVPRELWPTNARGLHIRKPLQTCVWCMTWFDEWGNEP